MDTSCPGVIEFFLTDWIQENAMNGQRIGYVRVSSFDQRTSTQLRHLAVTENRNVQAFLAQAIDLLFQARGLATRDE